MVLRSVPKALQNLSEKLSGHFRDICLGMFRLCSRHVLDIFRHMVWIYFGHDLGCFVHVLGMFLACFGKDCHMNLVCFGHKLWIQITKHTLRWEARAE